MVKERIDFTETDDPTDSTKTYNPNPKTIEVYIVESPASKVEREELTEFLRQKLKVDEPLKFFEKSQLFVPRIGALEEPQRY